MWIAIALITISSIILSFEDISSLSFSWGSLFVIIACLCWGLENNCTRMLSLKNPIQIVIIKGFGSGLGALLIAFLSKGFSYNYLYIVYTLLLGFFAYGLSIYFYIKAQRELGAARTSAYYSVAPFIGATISLLFFKQSITLSFIIALLIMITGAYLAAVEKHNHEHIHERMEHEHRHRHDDLHHNHTHESENMEEHSHSHVHGNMTHKHEHTSNLHHRHLH